MNGRSRGLLSASVNCSSIISGLLGQTLGATLDLESLGRMEDVADVTELVEVEVDAIVPGESI